MPVAVSNPSILKQWRKGEPLITVRSKVPAETLLSLVDVSVRRHDPNPQLGPEHLALQSWAVPAGVAVSIADCDSSEDVLAVVARIATELEDAGIDGRIGPLASDRRPWPHGRNDGFSAAVMLEGTPYWDAAGEPGERRLTQRMWDPDPRALTRLIEHAVDWCHVEGGALWITPDISSFKIPREHAAEVLTRLVGAGAHCSIVAAQDVSLVRRVAFDLNGYVIYEMGGTAQPDWRNSVDNLTSVLTDLHPLIQWGFALRRPRGRTGIGPATSRVVHEALWDPHVENVAGWGRIQDPRRYATHVLNVYGVQILGPEHELTALPAGWDSQPLTIGRKLVSSSDPGAWFADTPTLRTLLEARRDFGHLVDPIWSPIKD